MILAPAAGCGPLPGDEPYGRAHADREVVMFRTDHPRYSYLIDTRRVLCFLADGHTGRLTRIDCEDLPEAVELLGLDVSPYPPDFSEEAPVEDYEPVMEREDVPPLPAAEELARFEAAYVEVFCAYRRSRQDDEGPPDEDLIAARHGLTVERYQEIRRAVAADAVRWRGLSQRAIGDCP